MIRIGEYNSLKVLREKPMGLILDDGEEGVLLPKRFVKPNTQVGDEIEVFIYHDGEERPIATTQKPFGIIGDIVKLKVVSVAAHGAFLDWGLMKDLFIPKSAQRSYMRPNGEYLVKIVMDEQTGRVAATEKLEKYLSNETLSVKELEIVELLIYRKTEIGYEVIINNKHIGLLHFNEVYREIKIGDKFQGYIKKILPENRIDVAAGIPGYSRIEKETEKIVRLLLENNGYLPFNDKSSPDKVYSFFSMSKKSFKMALGSLYKEHRIIFTNDGIELTK